MPGSIECNFSFFFCFFYSLYLSTYLIPRIFAIDTDMDLYGVYTLLSNLLGLVEKHYYYISSGRECVFIFTRHTRFKVCRQCMIH